MEQLEQTKGRRDHADGRVAAIRASVPRFSILPDHPEFALRVASPRLIAVAQRYTTDRGSLAIIGPTGCGKTTAIGALVLRECATAVEAYERSSGAEMALTRAARITWTTAAALCIARKHHRLGEGEAAEIKRAEDAPLLVLDELGQEVADDRWLLELLDVRYAAELPTLITSGLTRSEIEARYGAGTTRRMIEPKGQFVDLFDGLVG